MKQEEPVSEKSLSKKIKNAISAAGSETIYHALVLFYTLESPNTPAWCKTVVLGSLGYFISLVDGIPDLTPLLGYTDDAALMAATVATISTHITPEIREKAEHKKNNLLGKSSKHK